MKIFIKGLAVFGLIMVLAGCASNPTQILRVEVERELVFPIQLVDCPSVRIPNPVTLTEEDISRLLRSYAATNRRCQASLNSFKTFFEERNKLIRETNARPL